MKRLLAGITGFIPGGFRSRPDMVFKNIALRQQPAVLKAEKPRPKLTTLDPAFWVLLRRVWTNWSNTLVIVQSETVVRLHRAGFRMVWQWKSRSRRPGLMLSNTG